MIEVIDCYSLEGEFFVFGYGCIWVVYDVFLCFVLGWVILLIGLNGSGKLIVFCVFVWLYCIEVGIVCVGGVELCDVVVFFVKEFVKIVVMLLQFWLYLFGIEVFDVVVYGCYLYCGWFFGVSDVD